MAPTFLQRLASAIKPPRARPFREMGVSGTSIHSGYVSQREKSAKWSGRQRYITSSDLAVNTSIVAAGLHHFLNLIAHPQWTARPADDSSAAQEAADFVEEVLESTVTPWPRIVRRAGMFRFHGFGLQEWTAMRRDDGSVVYKDIESRPQHTIERWIISPNGSVDGVIQRSPQTGEEFPIPRSKLAYLVDDTLSDSPEGIGIFRNLAEPYERLMTYYDLEARAFERDLRGTPVGRVPYSIIRKAVSDGKLDAADAQSLVQGMEDFVKLQIKQPDTGITLDSIPYESESADGRKVASIMQWGVELLQGSASGMAEVGSAIVRTQMEMARILTAEHLMMGESSGNRALSEDKSRNLYLVGNAVLSDIAAVFNRDLIEPIWTLNGFDDATRPTLEVEDVAFKDASTVAGVLREMATAGAVLAPDDKVIEDVRDLMGVSAPTPVDPALMGAPAPSTSPAPDEDEGEEEVNEEAEEQDDEAEKQDRPAPWVIYDERKKLVLDEAYSLSGISTKRFNPNQPRDPAGSATGGRWTSGGGSSSSGEEETEEETNSKGLSVSELTRGNPDRAYTGAELFSDQGDPEFVFHGTSSEVAKQIEANGLGGEDFRTYLASSSSTAFDEAGYAVHGDPFGEELPGVGGKRVIFMIDKNHPSVRDVRWKIDTGYDPHEVEGYGINVHSRNIIPPEAMRRMKGDLGDKVSARIKKEKYRIFPDQEAFAIDTPEIQQAVDQMIDSASASKKRIARKRLDPAKMAEWAAKFNPNQPRDPAGTDTGGQWAGAGGEGSDVDVDDSSGLTEEQIERLNTPSGKDYTSDSHASDELKSLWKESGGNALTRKEVVTLEDYTSLEFEAINDGLRHRKHAGIRDQVAVIDSAFDKMRLPKEITVTRSISHGTIKRVRAQLQAQLPGQKIFTDRAYLSTSVNPEFVPLFSPDDPKLGLMQITIPKGSRAIPVAVVSANSSEGEILLPRGSKFRITQIGMDNLKAELVQ